MAATYAVIGDPIDHSLSPNIHNAAFKETGLECTYIAYRIPKDELEEGIESLKKINIAGFNVTVPHKIGMIKYLDRMDEDCSVIGAANTVTHADGVLKGYNTDMDGFMDPIKKRNIQVRDASVLLLGSGGAARAITAAFAKEKAGSITIASRNLQKAGELAWLAINLGLNSDSTRLEDADGIAGRYKFIVNATPIGLRGEQSPIRSVPKSSVIYDIVYMPMNTDLIKKSKKAGATTIYGYEMLLGQACRSFEIWHKKKAPYEAMKKAVLGGF